MESLLAVNLGFRSHKATGEQTATRVLAPLRLTKTEQLGTAALLCAASANIKTKQPGAAEDSGSTMRTSANIRSQFWVRSTGKLLAEMREQPGGSAQDMAMFASVPTRVLAHFG
jgi:hypothetical protein